MGSIPPAPKGSVILPPEILDKILEYIPTHEWGWPTLIACAVVATWWTGHSQRRLFSSVSIDEYNYQRWMEGVVHSGSKARFLEHVRSFSHRRGLDTLTEYPMRDLARDSGEYFSALRNIHSLTLGNIRFEHISEEQFRTCFSAFRESLTRLSLETVTTSIGAFVTLVDYFPNIADLQLCSLVLEHDEEPVPPLSRPFRGKLRVSCFQHDRLEFFDRFAKLDLEYEELVVVSLDSFAFSTHEMREFLESALQMSTNTVKILRLITEPKSGVAPMINGFRQLRELELLIDHPSASQEVFLSSIASTGLRKIAFRVKHAPSWELYPGEWSRWSWVDKQLCGLAERLRTMGYGHTLEAELRIENIAGYLGLEHANFTNILPEFKEKGVLTVVDTDGGDRVIHSSVYNR